MRVARLAAAILAAALATSAQAATIKQTIDYHFLSGLYAGQNAHVAYTYLTPPDGQPVQSYLPQPLWAEARFLDVVGTLDPAVAPIQFWNSADILNPDSKMYFTFSDRSAFYDLLGLTVWRKEWVGIGNLDYRDGGNFYCGQDVNCTFEASVVPLPNTMTLLGTSLLLGTVIFRQRRRRRSARLGVSNSF